MVSAKDIVIKPITAKAANAVVRRIHYSGKVVPNSTLHFGAFLNGKLEGAMSFGSPIDRRKVLPLVAKTSWYDMIELNRMAFSSRLPKNSESRAMAIAFKLIKKHYPNIEWVLSFSDCCQSGDGAIYRAAGFELTGIKKNSTMLRTPSGEVVADKTFNNRIDRTYKGFKKSDCEKLPGYQIRYIYFINKAAKERLTVPILPYSEISKMGIGMYKGEKITRVKRQDSENPSELGGSIPTCALQNEKTREAL